MRRSLAGLGRAFFPRIASVKSRLKTAPAKIFTIVKASLELI
jgi:hypothetical protein